MHFLQLEPVFTIEFLLFHQVPFIAGWTKAAWNEKLAWHFYTQLAGTEQNIPLVTLDNFSRSQGHRAGDVSFKCLPYQVSMVGDLPTMLITGSGESGFDSGEGAWGWSTWPQGPEYCCLPTRRHTRYRYVSGRDSNLEAFSHKPSDGGLSAEHLNQRSEPAVPLVLSRITMATAWSSVG